MRKQDVVARLVSQKCSTTLENLLEQAFDAGRDFERETLQTAVSVPLRELMTGIQEARTIMEGVQEMLAKP